MGKIFKYKCDKCGVLEDAHWNSEHYLPPVGWATIVRDGFQKGHVCPTCDPLSPTQISSEDMKA